MKKYVDAGLQSVDPDCKHKKEKGESSMKKKILALLLSVAIAGNLIACGNAASTSSSSDSGSAAEDVAQDDQEAEEESGGAEIIGGSLEDETTTVKAGEKEASAVVDVVKVATTDNPADLSPWGGNSSGAVGWLYLFYESLFIEEYKGEMEPCLAKSYTQDGNIITVELFDYIKDSAGNAFTANDVVFSLDKAIEGGNISYTKILGSYRAVDDYTVELTLNDGLTVGDLETFFTNVYYVTEAAYNASADGMVTDPVGTGHYAVTEYTNGYNLVVEARDDWWQTDEEYIASRSVANAERIEVYVMSDATSAAIAVETGEVDIAGVSSTDLPTVEATEGLSVYTFMMSLTRILMCNCSEDSVLQDVNLRKAVYYALDNEGLAQMLISGVGVPVYDMANSNYPDYYEDYYKELAKDNFYSYDVEKSKELLSEAGYGSGLELTLITDSTADSIAVAEGIQAYLLEAGITVKIDSYQSNMLTSVAEDPTAWDIYLRQTASNNYASVAWSRPFLAANYSNGGTCNFIMDDTLQEKLNFVNTDEGHTEENVKELYNYIVDNAYGYGLLCGTSYFAMSDKLKKLSFNASIMLSPNSCIYN